MSEIIIQLIQSLEYHVADEDIRMSFYKDIIPVLEEYSTNLSLEDLSQYDHILKQAIDEYKGLDYDDE